MDKEIDWEWFTGTVRIESPFKKSDSAKVSGAIVTFEFGARTSWHMHSLGQTLIVTAGCGRVQRWGGPIEEIQPGDVIWFSARCEALVRGISLHGNNSHRHCGGTR